MYTWEVRGVVVQPVKSGVVAEGEGRPGTTTVEACAGDTARRERRMRVRASVREMAAR
jgi:hypothetical protein|tara:strand:- start:67 stop:240 length:174 start_codon:yes stop_codon:yes gene_type:complete